ncbi:MAG: SDR family NAD(P)-dependent oxidoreductase [Armatimonadota bacterium]
MNDSRSAIIISASSDIGAAMARRWHVRGWKVTGTYRTRSSDVTELESLGITLVQCDLADSASVDAACARLRETAQSWDILVLCPGTLEPVGPFSSGDFEAWETSVRVNFTGQMRMIHALLPARRQESPEGPCVLLFAGGGANSAPVNYSAYTVSKIALIKMSELLDAEIPDTRFVIVGPGWVHTKIHAETLRSPEQAGSTYQQTVDKLAGSECTPMEEVLDCCDWLVSAPRSVVSGRNFSVVYDRWGSDDLTELLREDPGIYKLRRAGNDRLVKED